MSEQAQPLRSGHADVAAAAVSGGKRKRILLIEDEARTRLVLLQKLRTAGFDVDSAPNEHLALDKLRSIHPDAIFMDLLLPYKKGAAVIKEARKDPAFGDRPIYVCTSAALMEAWSRRGIQAGATKVFNKATTPIDHIIAEVATDVLGPGFATETPQAPTPEPSPSPPASPTPPQAPTEVPNDVAGSDLPEPVAQESNPGAPAVKSSGKPFNFMKLALKTFGLVRKDHPPSGPPAPTAPPPIPTEAQPTEPSQETAIWFRVGSEAKPASASGQEHAGQAGGLGAAPMSPDIGVVQIDKDNNIVSASDLCAAMFGWESLVGQPVGVLLKGGLDNDLGRFLQRNNPANPNPERSSFRVTALRKDATEFPASVILTQKSDDPRCCWTAVFGVLDTGTAFVLANDPAQRSGSQVTAPGAHEELKQQIEALTAEAARHRAALTSKEKEYQQLMERISSHETELNRARTALEREIEERKQLEYTLQEIAGTKSELEQQLAEHSRTKEELLKSSTELRAQLEETRAAAERAEAACRQEVERAHRFEADLVNLQQGHEELNGKLAAEQQSAAESKLRSEELEARLRENATELERVKTDAARQAEERERLDAGLRAQMNAAKTAAEQAEAALKEEAARNKRFEERLRLLGNSLRQEQHERHQRFEKELTGLRQERDDFHGKLTVEQQAVAESNRRAEELENRLRENAAEFERAKAELEKQTAERERSESEWREQMNAEKALAKKLEAAWQEAAERKKRFEEELTGLRQVRDEFNAKLMAEQLAAAESKRRAEELESRLRENANELERVKAELEKTDSSKHSEEKLASLQQLRDELSGNLRTEQEATMESRHRVDELEKRLRENTAELERVKADRDKHAEEQGRLESELRAQLSAARVAAERAESLLKEKVAQCNQFEKELASIRQGRDEINGRLAAEQQSASESRRRSEELEARLRESAAELERVKADADKVAEERGHLESDLREQLNAAKTAVEAAEMALREKAERNRSFEEQMRIFGNSLRLEQLGHARQVEEELAGLQLVRDDLAAKLAAEQEAAAESRRRNEEFELRLQQTAAELERVRAEAGRHAEARGRLESELREQSNRAKAAAGQAEAVQKEQAARCGQLEEQLAGLQQVRDELHDKLAAEQQVVMESRRHSQDLENRLREATGELERVKADLARQAGEHADVESDLRGQLHAARLASEQAEAVHRDQAVRRVQTEEALSGLQFAHDELNGKLTAEQLEVTESRRHSEDLENRLREAGGELERVKADLARHLEERNNVESDLRGQLQAVKAAAEQAEAAHREQAARRVQIEESLVGLQQVRDELHGKLSAEQQVAAESRRHSEELENRLREAAGELERVKADLARHVEERNNVESDLRGQLQTVKAAAEEAEAAHREQAARRAQIEEALARQAEERGNVESDLRAQLHAAKSAAEQAESAVKENIVQSRKAAKRFENELASLRQERHQIYDKFMAEHQAGAKSKRRIKELEKSLHETATCFANAKAELGHRAAEHAKLESELRPELEAAKAAAQLAEAACQKESARCSRQEQDMADLLLMRETLGAQLVVEQQAAAESRQRIEHLESHLGARSAELERVKTDLAKESVQRSEMAGLERRFREGITSLARLTAELERERAERQRSEQRAAILSAQLGKLHDDLRQHIESERISHGRIGELEQQLSRRQEEVLRLTAELQQETADRRLAEEQLRAVGDMSNQLRSYLALFEESKQVFKRAQEELESRLQTNLNALTESESRLQKEASARRNLEDALATAQSKLNEHSQKSASDLSKLQSELLVEQFERKRLEGDALQSRFTSLDSARSSRALLNKFRRHIRQAVDELMKSTRRLMEVRLADEQAKLVQSVLENALLVQTSLQDPDPFNGRSTGAEGDGQRGVTPLVPTSDPEIGNRQP